MSHKTLDTPQRRHEVQQLVHNAFPGCSAVFGFGPTGAVAFRIRHANGRYRSQVIKLLAHHVGVRLNRAWLARQIKARGGPGA